MMAVGRISRANNAPRADMRRPRVHAACLDQMPRFSSSIHYGLNANVWWSKCDQLRYERHPEDLESPTGNQASASVFIASM